MNGAVNTDIPNAHALVGGHARVVRVAGDGLVADADLELFAADKDVLAMALGMLTSVEGPSAKSSSSCPLSSNIEMRASLRKSTCMLLSSPTRLGSSGVGSASSESACHAAADPMR